MMHLESLGLYFNNMQKNCKFEKFQIFFAISSYKAKNVQNQKCAKYDQLYNFENNLSLKYQSFTPLGYKYIVIRKYEFVAQTQFLFFFLCQIIK